MNRLKTFSFRVNSKERAMISVLAERLQRNQSDAIRYVVVNAAKELSENKLITERHWDGDRDDRSS